jgi:hypothetical protein
MAKLKSETETHDKHSGNEDALGLDPIDEAPDDQGEIIATAATIAVVAVGAAVFEAALLPGLALGVVAALAPRVLPNIGSAMAPCSARPCAAPIASGSEPARWSPRRRSTSTTSLRKPTPRIDRGSRQTPRPPFRPPEA